MGLMSVEDLESGLEVARTAGELWAVSDVVDLMEMPVLAAFLETRGELLQNVAVEIIVRAAGTRALSQVLAEEGDVVADLGVGEVAEGLVRAAASEAMAERSDELAVAGVGLAIAGAKRNWKSPPHAADVAGELVDESLAGAMVGGAELGAAGTMDAVAEALEETSEE